MSDKETKIINQPYYSSQNTYAPRYNQRNAINRTVDAIAKGQQRLLLVMATGTGKFHIIYIDNHVNWCYTSCCNFILLLRGGNLE